MPTKDELTTQLQDMTARAEAAEAKLEAGDGGDNPEPAEYPLPGGGDTTDDASTAIAAWQEAAANAGDDAETEAMITSLRSELGDRNATIAAAEEVMSAMNKEVEELKAAGSGLSEEAAAELAETKEKLTAAKMKVASLQRQLGEMRLVAGDLNSLTTDEVRQILKKDTVAKFMVTSDYEFMSQKMERGREIQGRHYPALLQYVGDGLKLVQAQ